MSEIITSAIKCLNNSINNNEFDFGDWLQPNMIFYSKDNIYDIMKIYNNLIKKTISSIIIQCAWRKYKSKLFVIKFKKNIESNKIKVIKGYYKGLKGYLVKKTPKKVKVTLFMPEGIYGFIWNGGKYTVYLNKNSIKPIKKRAKRITKRLGLNARCLNSKISGIIIKDTKLGVHLYTKDDDDKKKIIFSQNIELI
jgi:hypothetical protein